MLILVNQSINPCVFLVFTCTLFIKIFNTEYIFTTSLKLLSLAISSDLSDLAQGYIRHLSNTDYTNVSTIRC